MFSCRNSYEICRFLTESSQNTKEEHDMEDTQQTSTHFICSESKCNNYYILGQATIAFMNHFPLHLQNRASTKLKIF
jgi:hypothetical protein